MNRRVMFVDDEPSVLAAFRRNLCEEFEVEPCGSGAEAVESMERKGPPAVVVADMRMPEMSGVELLLQVYRRWPDTVRLMLTGNSDQQTAVDAVNRGQVFRFLTKPCSTPDLAGALREALERHRVIAAERALLEGTLNGTVAVLSEVLQLAEPESFRRGQKLRGLVRRVTEQLGLGARWDIELAALLSELGWITVPPELVMKVRAGSELTAAESKVIGRVPDLGADLLARIPRLERVAEYIRHQNRRFESERATATATATATAMAAAAGGEAEAVALGARILKAAGDLVRIEDDGESRERALGRMQRRMGWYDPKVLAALFESLEMAPETPAAEALRVHAVGLEEVVPGCLLVEDVRTKEGVLIVTSGTQVTAPLLNRLRNFADTTGVVEPLKVRFPAPI